MLLFVLLLIFIICITIYKVGGYKDAPIEIKDAIIKIGNCYIFDGSESHKYPSIKEFKKPDELLVLKQWDDIYDLVDESGLSDIMFKNGKQLHDISNHKYFDLYYLIYTNMNKPNKMYIKTSYKGLKKCKKLFDYEEITEWIGQRTEVKLWGVEYVSFNDQLLLLGERHLSYRDILLHYDIDDIKPYDTVKYYFQDLDEYLQHINKHATLFIEHMDLHKEIDIPYYNIPSIIDSINSYKNINVQFIDIRKVDFIRRDDDYFINFNQLNKLLFDYDINDYDKDTLEKIKDEFSISPTYQNNDKYSLEIKNNTFIPRATYELNRLREENYEIYNKIKNYSYNTRFNTRSHSGLMLPQYYMDMYTIARLCRKQSDYNIVYTGKAHTNHIHKILTTCGITLAEIDVPSCKINYDILYFKYNLKNRGNYTCNIF